MGRHMTDKKSYKSKHTITMAEKDHSPLEIINVGFGICKGVIVKPVLHLYHLANGNELACMATR